MAFPCMLRGLLEERHITQRQLACELHIPVSTLGGYVQGTSEPDFETLKIIAGYFNVSTDYLLEFLSDSAGSENEQRLLALFRSLSEEEHNLYIEIGKTILKTSKTVKV